MKRLRFGLDLDGVFGDFGEMVKVIAGRLWPGKMPADYIPTNWDYTDVFSKEDWNRVWTEIKAKPYFWFYEKDYPEAVDAMRHFIMKYDDIEVYYITSRVQTMGGTVLQQSYQWLQNRSMFRDGRMSIVPVQDGKDKVPVIRGLRLPYFLDDYAPTIQLLQAVEGTKAYLLDQPWNRYADHLPRLYSVREYLDIVAANVD